MLDYRHTYNHHLCQQVQRKNKVIDALAGLLVLSLSAGIGALFICSVALH